MFSPKDTVYTFAIEIVADKEILGKPGDFARRLGIIVNSSRSDGFDFYLDGYVDEVLAMMSRTAREMEKLTRKVEQKIVCYYSQDATAINRENDKMKNKLFAMEEEYRKRSSIFSFKIGNVYPFRTYPGSPHGQGGVKLQGRDSAFPEEEDRVTHSPRICQHRT